MNWIKPVDCENDASHTKYIALLSQISKLEKVYISRSYKYIPKMFPGGLTDKTSNNESKQCRFDTRCGRSVNATEKHVSDIFRANNNYTLILDLNSDL